MLTVEFDLTPINIHFAELTGSIADAVRPAAQAGAQILYDEAKLRAPISDKEHSTKGKRHTFTPGNLKRSIYQAYIEGDSVDGVRATYSISWNKSKAFYGQFVEFGTSNMPAKSFIRSSYEAVGSDAAQEVERVLIGLVKGAL